MKFRCERDTLAEAVAPPSARSRAAAGALPVLSGLRVTATDGRPRAGRLRPRAHDPGPGPGRGRGRRAARSCPQAVLRDRAQARAGPGAVEVDRRRRARSPPGRFATTLRLLPADEFPRLARADGQGVRVDAGRVRRGAAPGGPRPRRRDDARPILTGVLLTATAGGLRLVATDSYRLAVRDLAGREHARPRARRCSSAAKGLAEVQRLSPATARSRSCSASARSCSDVARRGHHAADRGRVPELPAADPERLPEPAHGRRATRSRRRSTACGSSARAATTPPIRLAMSADGPRALGDRAGRRRGARVGRGEVRGHRAHRRVQLAVPARRHRRGRRPTRSCSRRSTR